MSSEDPETPEEDSDDGAETSDEVVPPSTFESRLDEAAEAVEAAETEADLDDAAEQLDAVETDLEEATLESDADAEGEEADADPKEVLTDRVDELRDSVEEQRGPYAEAVTAELGSAEETITSTEWTVEGLGEIGGAAQQFVETAGEVLGESFPIDTGNSETISTGLSDVSAAIERAALHPDEDAEAITTLLEAAGDLTAALDDAQVFGDLEIREQLERLGFYDVLSPRNRRDFPPEWNAIKLYESRGEVEPILTALDKLDSDFMQDNVLDALEHIAPEEAVDDVQALAKRRNKQPVRILGRIGDERACDMLEGFLGGGDVELEKTTLWALGCIGSEESTEPVAQRLAADNPEVRSAAARSLGLLGDTRAIDPLADRLAEDDDERVRASAAWALNQVGTERALDAVAEYADDRSYLVQAEAEKATGV
jgi:HEAT repeat protein